MSQLDTYGSITATKKRLEEEVMNDLAQQGITYVPNERRWKAAEVSPKAGDQHPPIYTYPLPQKIEVTVVSPQFDRLVSLLGGTPFIVPSQVAAPAGDQVVTKPEPAGDQVETPTEAVYSIDGFIHALQYLQANLKTQEEEGRVTTILKDAYSRIIGTARTSTSNLNPWEVLQEVYTDLVQSFAAGPDRSKGLQLIAKAIVQVDGLPRKDVFRAPNDQKLSDRSKTTIDLVAYQGVA